MPPASPTGGFSIAQALLFAALAAVAALVWQAIGRAPTNDERLHKLARLLMRYLLAFATLHYGITTLLRFSSPALTYELLVTPVGDLRPWELFWAFVGW